MNVLLILFVTAYFCFTSSEKTSGKADFKDGFSYLGKFCFGYQGTDDDSNDPSGIIDVILSINDGEFDGSYYLVLYDDQSSSFDKIYDTGLTCTEKLNPDYYRYLRDITTSSSNYELPSVEIHEHIRPRWWWLYLVNCNSSKTDKVSIDYDTHFYQLDVSDWNKEAGINDRGLNTMYLFYTCLYFGLCCLQFYAYRIYRVQQYVHQIIKLLTATIIFEFCGILFHFIDWIIFTKTGEHELFFQIIAPLIETIAQTIFLLLLLLLAQGWTISRFDITRPKLLLAGCVIAGIFQSGFYLWRLIGIDDESVVYFYDSPPEYCYGSLMIILGILFIIQCFYSWKTENLENKKTLFLVLGVVYSVWFILPFAQIGIGDAFDSWSRDVAINTISTTWTAISYIIMMGLMWPSWAHTYFNLNAGETQDRIMGTSAAKPEIYKRLQEDRL